MTKHSTDYSPTVSKKTIPTIAYPIVKENGEEFASQEEILTQLSGESGGLYLISDSGYWHGGIHVSAVTTPWSALSGNAEHEDKTAFTGKQPIRCMVDGELVAYRVNQSYDKTNFGREGDDYLFSSSFVLVKHRYQAGEKPESGIDFYSLSMHLAPYEAYEAQEESETLYRIEEKSLSIYASQTDIQGQKLGTLPRNTEIWVNNGEAEYTHPTSGRKYKQARLAKDDGQSLTTFWILSDKGTENIAPVTTQVTVAPWLQNLMTPVDENTPAQFGGFDKVVVLNEPIPIKAKDAIGHMGLFQIEDNTRPTHHYMVHIELLSADENFRNFIESKDKLTDEEHKATLTYIKYSKDNPITRYRYDSTTQTMTPYDGKTLSTGILSIERSAKQSIADAVEVVGENATPSTTTYYYSEAEKAYLSEHELQHSSQYDFSALGYTLFEAKIPTFKKLGWFDRVDRQSIKLDFEVVDDMVVEMLQSLVEFTKSNFGRHFSWPEGDNLNNQLNQIIKEVQRQKHFVRPETVLRFLTYKLYHPDHYYRFITKHISEWYFDYDSAPWEQTDIFIKLFNKKVAEGKKAQIEKLIWMKEVPAFNTEKPIWHMQPIVFLDGLKYSKKESKCEEKFKKISSIVFNNEGGYVNDPDDKGGETNMGITIATWRAYAKEDLGIEPTSENLKNLSKKNAETIYFKRYWDAKGFCKINNIKTALMIYDWTITSGRAIVQIQRMMNDKYLAQLTPDNVIGDLMINFINNIEDQDELALNISKTRKAYYESLTYTDGVRNNQIKYLKGWLDRVDRCMEFIE